MSKGTKLQVASALEKLLTDAGFTSSGVVAGKHHTGFTFQHPVEDISGTIRVHWPHVIEVSHQAPSGKHRDILGNLADADKFVSLAILDGHYSMTTRIPRLASIYAHVVRPDKPKDDTPPKQAAKPAKAPTPAKAPAKPKKAVKTPKETTPAPVDDATAQLHAQEYEALVGKVDMNVPGRLTDVPGGLQGISDEDVIPGDDAYTTASDVAALDLAPPDLTPLIQSAVEQIMQSRFPLPVALPTGPVLTKADYELSFGGIRYEVPAHVLSDVFSQLRKQGVNI